MDFGRCTKNFAFGAGIREDLYTSAFCGWDRPTAWANTSLPAEIMDLFRISETGHPAINAQAAASVKEDEDSASMRIADREYGYVLLRVHS